MDNEYQRIHETNSWHAYNDRVKRIQSKQYTYICICRSGQISIEYRVLAWPYGLLGRPEIGSLIGATTWLGIQLADIYTPLAT